MKKFSKNIRLMAYTTLVLAVISGMFWANVNRTLNASGECILLKNECSFSTSKGELWLKFEQTPVAEEELLISFDVPEGLTINRASIQGINMFMGKTPVLFEDGLPENTGVTFLGSCNLAEMQWAMTLELEADGVESNVKVLFSTYQ